MEERQNQPSDGSQLRRHAEERLNRRSPESGGQETQSETERLVHELEVHQVELEMQNQELQQTRANLEVLLAQYADLYDFAPTGYFNLAPDGTILGVNLTGARLVGIDRDRLLKRRFTVLVSVGDWPVFNAFLEKTFAGNGREFCEVALTRAEAAPLFARVEAVVSEGQRECRAAVWDVTDRHKAEVERERLIQELQTALARVKTLSGLLPICSNCKKIRNDQGYWNQVETYISSHSEATFTHGICPECLLKLYPEFADRFSPEPGVSAPEPATTGTPAETIPPEQHHA